VVFDERSSRRAALNGETVADMLGICIAVCGSNEWDDELLNSIEQL
jgi:hypothetical protein